MCSSGSPRIFLAKALNPQACTVAPISVNSKQAVGAEEVDQSSYLCLLWRLGPCFGVLWQQLHGTSSPETKQKIRTGKESLSSATSRTTKIPRRAKSRPPSSARARITPTPADVQLLPKHGQPGLPLTLGTKSRGLIEEAARCADRSDLLLAGEHFARVFMIRQEKDVWLEKESISGEERGTRPPLFQLKTPLIIFQPSFLPAADP